MIFRIYERSASRPLFSFLGRRGGRWRLRQTEVVNLNFSELVENWYVATFGLGMLVALLSPQLAILVSLALGALIILEMHKKEKSKSRKK
jgi:hypothetical protein